MTQIQSVVDNTCTAAVVLLGFGDGSYGDSTLGGECGQGVSPPTEARSLYDSAPMGLAPGAGPEKPRRRGLNQTGPIQNITPYSYGSGRGGAGRSYNRILESDDGETLLVVAKIVEPTTEEKEAFVQNIIKDKTRVLNDKEREAQNEIINVAKGLREDDDLDAILLLLL